MSANLAWLAWKVAFATVAAIYGRFMLPCIFMLDRWHPTVCQPYGCWLLVWQAVMVGVVTPMPGLSRVLCAPS